MFVRDSTDALMSWDVSDEDECTDELCSLIIRLQSRICSFACSILYTFISQDLVVHVMMIHVLILGP